MRTRREDVYGGVRSPYASLFLLSKVYSSDVK